jgi:hypothetical protein
MNILMIVLRLIHIFGGFLWFGISFFYVRFLTPTVQATGPEGQRFIQKMAQVTPINSMIAMVGMGTTLSGLIMYGIVSGGFQGSWITSPYGLAITFGGIFGIAEAVHGALILGRTANRLAELGQQLESAGRPPSPEQIAEMQTLQAKLQRGGVRGVIFLSLALIGMSIAQYL